MPPLSPDKQLSWTGVNIGSARPADGQLYRSSLSGNFPLFVALVLARWLAVQGLLLALGRLDDALAFAIWSPSPDEIPTSLNQLARREPHAGSLETSPDRTQHGRD